MPIISRFSGGCSDGDREYKHKRPADNPTPWAFVYANRRNEIAPGEKPQASIYRLREVSTEGENTIWHYDFDHYATSHDAIRWMRDHVDPDDENW